jgi:hypothetical protein
MLIARMAAPASAGEKVAVAGPGAAVETSMDETVVIGKARVFTECGRARTPTSVAGGHVRFRAEGLRRNTRPAKKRLQFHSVHADPLKALRTRQSGHLRQNIFYACPLSGIGGAARLAIEAAVPPRRANPRTSSGANR